MATIVLYPSPGMGHLISMVELGKHISKHHPSFSIVVLTLIPSFNTGTTATYVRQISATFPAITFHHLPDIPLDPLLFPSMEAIIFELIRRSNPNVDRALQSISSSSKITAFVIDTFCAPAMSLAENINVPVYYFFTSGACCLALLLYMPTIHKTTTESIKDMNTLIHLPGLPPIPPSDMLRPLLDRTSAEYSDFLGKCEHLPKSAGIIINTFDSLEPKALKAINDGVCVPDGSTPPIYCMGPLIVSGDDGSHECLNWLDLQPSGSVVYLCFGSLGVFSSEQLKEIAKGLDRRMLDDFVDVTQHEKQMMHLWNSFIRKQRVLADAHVPWACEAFSTQHGEEFIRNPEVLWCWNLFMIKLWNHGLLDAKTMNSCHLILENFREQNRSQPTN